MVSQWGIEPHRLTLVSSPTCGARWGFPQGIFDEPEGADGDSPPAQTPESNRLTGRLREGLRAAIAWGKATFWGNDRAR